MEIAIECLENGVPVLHYDAVNITAVDLEALSRYKRAAGFEFLTSGGGPSLPRSPRTRYRVLPYIADLIFQVLSSDAPMPRF